MAGGKAGGAACAGENTPVLPSGIVTSHRSAGASLGVWVVVEDAWVLEGQVRRTITAPGH